MSELTKEKLLEVRGLIELGWTQGTPTSDGGRARCYCLGGAITKVLFGDPFKMYDRDGDVQGALQEFVTLADLHVWTDGGLDADGNYDSSLGSPDWSASIYNFNDEHTKEEVLAAIDKAVTNLENSDQ